MIDGTKGLIRAVFGACFCCALLVSVRAAEPRGKIISGAFVQTQVSVDFKTKEPIFTLHEPIVVLFSVHNAFAHPITLTLGAQSRQFFQFALTTPNGNIVDGSLPQGWRVNMETFGTGKVVVAPDTDYQQQLIMNQWFEFKAEGTYVLTAKLTTKIAVSGGADLSPESQEIRIAIGPRNSARLEKLCAELEAQVGQAAGVAQATGPALQLSYIEDPIAVQYLSRILFAMPSYDYILVPGLERIGNDQSVAALLSALNEKSGDVSDTAEAALRRMRDRISNPALKERVSQALESKAAARTNH